MLISNQVRPAGTWDGAALADTVVLDFDGRHRRRVAMTGKGGLAFLLDLPQTTALREGDGLVLSDGRIVRVNAAPEQLMEITAPDFATVVRIAWHLGNRHVPAQLAQDRLRIRHDHVMMEMAVDLGGAVAEIEAPFDPEAGAFAHSAHDHHHGATEAHAHTHEHGHHQHPHEH